MSIEIRVLQAGDEGVCAMIAEDVFDDALVPTATAAFLADPRHHLLVAIDGETIVGFVSGVHYVHPDKAAPEFWINEVGVAPSHQRRGLGKALMQATLDHARGLGCQEAWVLTEHDNLAARTLYASAGGEESPERIVMLSFKLGD